MDTGCCFYFPFLCGTESVFYLSINYTYELWHFLPDGGHSSVVCVHVCVQMWVSNSTNKMRIFWREMHILSVRKGKSFSVEQLNYNLLVPLLIILPSFLRLLLSHHALNVRSALWNSYLIRASTGWSTGPLLFLGISWGLVSHTKLMSSTWKRHFHPDLPF